MDYINTLSTILLFFVVGLTLKHLWVKFKQGGFSVVMPLIAVSFIFLVLPIVLDFLFGKPDFTRFKGFNTASKSIEIDIVYNLYITFVFLMFRNYLKKSNTPKISFSSKIFFSTAYKHRYLLWFLMLLPIIFVLLSNDPSLYLNYKANQLFRDRTFKDTHVFVGKSVLISVFAASILFYLLKNKANSSLLFPKYVLYVLLFFISFWVDGKRGVLAKYFFLLIVSGWFLGEIKPTIIIRRIFYAISFLVFFVISYGKDFTKGNDLYSNFRLNLGRDHTIKYTLFKELIVNEPILEYRGQSFYFDLIFFIPRVYWPEKPYPYAVYLITDVLNLPKEPIGWSFTTCILEEMISNFGIVGILIAPLFLIKLCKIGDNSSNVFLTLFSIIVSVFFMFTQLPAFMPLFILFLFLYIKKAKNKIYFQ